jgi:hypothetical protein
MPDFHDQYAGQGGCYIVGEDGIRVRVPFDVEPPAPPSHGQSSFTKALDSGKAGRSKLRSGFGPDGDERDSLHESGDHPAGG